MAQAGFAGTFRMNGFNGVIVFAYQEKNGSIKT